MRIDCPEGARLNKQPSARHCFVCGVQNPLGLKLQFFDDGVSTVRAEFQIADQYNGYPGVAHGGIVAAILDEASARALLAARGHDPANLVVTVKMELRYRRPTPTAAPLVAVGWIEQDDGRRARVKAEMRLADGTVTAEADCLVARPPEEVAQGWESERPYWRVYE
jgi:acyl-coenzyme A thioesterase PaaI-like protein